MALNKQQVNVNFSKGLDTKSDPWQVPIGNFLNLENSVFNKFGLLEKRKGFEKLVDVSNLDITSLSVFKNELIGLGNSLYSYRKQDGTLLNRGVYQPAEVKSQSLVKNTNDQIQCDAAVADNDACCTAYTEQTPAGVTTYKYEITNYKTSQVIVSPTVITAASSGTVNYSPRVYVTNTHFIILFGALVSGVQQLQFLAIDKNSFTATGPTTLSTDFYRGKASVDAVVVDGFLYFAWGRASAGGIFASFLNTSLQQGSVFSIQTSFQGDVVAMTYDVASDSIFISYFSNATNTGRVTARNQIMAQIFAPVDFVTTTATTRVSNLTLSSLNGTCQIIWERENYYAYNTTIPTSYIQKRTVTSAGALGTSPGTTALVRSLGLGAKSFILNNKIYIVAAYESINQSGFYLLDLNANTVAKWSYTNGGGYINYALPNSTVLNSVAYISYLTAFFVRSINKDINDSNYGVYSQLGVNLISVNLGDVPVYTAELGNNLNMSGGFLWSYDGNIPNENNFFVYPEYLKVNPRSSTVQFTATYTSGSANVTVSSSSGLSVGTKIWNEAFGFMNVTAVNSATSITVNFQAPSSQTNLVTYAFGNLTPQKYFYTAIYEWTDNQGNVIRSSPAQPLEFEILQVTNVTNDPINILIGNTQTGSNLITDLSVLTTPGNLQVGQLVVGNGIPNGSYITEVRTPDKFAVPGIVISNNATLTQTGVSLFYFPLTTASVDVPTLRFTYKPDVAIRLYRWSEDQQTYHITASAQNNKSVDYVTISDGNNDESISSFTILYTVSGVENLPGPPSGPMTIWDNRLWVLDTEEPNSLWYSKTVIDGVSCEMSDLFTFYINPTNSAQGSTSPVTALSVMDDKLLVFKKDAIYYINGTGPDALGNNSQFSEPILITSTVGTSLPNSVCVIPEGLLFQSDKGIWLVGRNGQTMYLGAPVESYTQTGVCLASSIIPGTNQARFVMSDNNVLMYDYFFQQWGNFTGVDGKDSIIYDGKQTILDTHQRILIESTNAYEDAGNPVLMKFTTNWFALAGILGFQRAYFFFLLGKYYSPHKLTVKLAYDFNPNATQTTVITPNNFNANWGNSPVYGDVYAWGGNESVERWRVMLQRQKCDSVQIIIEESFDPSLGVNCGPGLTLSGMNFIIGVKREFNTVPANITVG